MIFRSPFRTDAAPDAFVDDEVLTGLGARGPRVAVVDAATGRSLTGAQLVDGARRVAAGLARRGLGRGDVAGLVAANGPDTPVVVLGALAAGVAVAPANPALTSAELARVFARTRPRAVVADPGVGPVVEAATASQPGVDLLLTDSLSDAFAAAGGPVPGRRHDDVAFLFTSSGTTGLPKTVAHSHAGTTAFLRRFADAPLTGFTARDTVAVVVPFTHLFGTAVLLHSLRCGARVATLPRFEFDSYLRMLQDQPVTVAVVTPPLLRALARDPRVDRYDLSPLRLLILGAARPEIWDAWRTAHEPRIPDALRCSRKLITCSATP